MAALRFRADPSVVCLALALAAAWAPAALAAQAAPASRAASYTQAQADQGRDLYAESCVRCHGEELMGGEGGGPPLLGESLAYTWGGQRITGLLRFVQTNMPMSDPGTLEPAQAAAVVAYVLSMNGVAAGETPLSSSSTGLLILPPAADATARETGARR